MNKDTGEKDLNKVILTVSEFSRILKAAIENAFYSVRVKGEISGLKTNYSSGYYFDLKDESSKLKCIIFKGDLSKVKFDIKDGLSVTVYGRINLYEPRGEYSFIVSEIEPLGFGELYILFERLKEKLRREGLFDESRKRAIPFLPETIGIVTSKSGAVLHDIVKILKTRFENISVIFANASVQGQNSASEIAHAVELLNLYSAARKKIDVIIVGRGGGSIEDLWAFNEEITARAIYNSSIPVISAVGHETDFTIADFVADKRASTPSNAAEMVVPVKSELVKHSENLKNRLKIGALNLISNRKAELSNLIKNIEKVSPKRIIQNKRIRVYDLAESLQNSAEGRINLLKLNVSHLYKRLLLKSPLNVFKERKLYINGLSGRLRRAAEITIANYKSRVGTECKALNSLSPYNVLKRGYGIVFSEEKKVVSSVMQVKENEIIRIVLNDGGLSAKVLEAEPNVQLRTGK
jgi:exodeoxyribonuclease VII large subunit